MEPISTTIAAIAAVRGAIETASNIKDIGNSLENLFSDHEKKEKKPKKKGKNKPSTRMQQVLRMRSGDEGYDDETSISAVANKVLEDKQKALKKAKADKIFWDKVLLEGRNVGIIIVMVVSLYYFLSWACKGCV